MNLRAGTVLFALSALAMGCDDEPATFTWPANTASAVANYATVVEASYGDSVTTAQTLKTRLDEFVAAPSQVALAAAKTAWLESREPYLQTEVYRFYDGPIDNPADGPEGLLNAWPLDEHYIDYVADDADAGIINGTESIDADALASLNEVGGEKNVATGYHAVEFLLWGQDTDPAGPGARPFTDYVTDGSGTAANQDRRGLYLTTVGARIVSDLEQVHSAWKDGASYRVGFVAKPKEAFAKMLTGMIILAGFETGGERLQAALDSGDQESEHSCFSDNTHRDMIQDVQGLWNVWHGEYTRTNGNKVTGVGARNVVTQVDAALATRVGGLIDEAMALALALNTPFDQEILPGAPGNARVQALVSKLQAVEQSLFDVFTAFKLTVAIPTE